MTTLGGWAAWAGAFLIGFALALLLAATGGPAVLALSTPAWAWAWRVTPWGRRQLECLGWAAEWLHGAKVAPALYASLDLHASALKRGYHVFDDIPEEEVERQLRRRLPLARLLLALVGRRLAVLERKLILKPKEPVK